MNCKVSAVLELRSGEKLENVFELDCPIPRDSVTYTDLVTEVAKEMRNTHGVSSWKVKHSRFLFY